MEVVQELMGLVEVSLDGPGCLVCRSQGPLPRREQDLEVTRRGSDQAGDLEVRSLAGSFPLSPSYPLSFCCAHSDEGNRRGETLVIAGGEPESGIEPLTCALRVRCSA